MRILMIAPEPFFEPRGTPFSEFHRIRALTALGHQVDLVTYPFGEDVSMPGLRVIRALRPPFVTKVKIGPSAAKFPLDALLAVTAFRVGLSGKYDAVHSHEEAGVIGVVLSWLLRVPHLYDMHSSLPQQLTNFAFTGSTVARGIVRWFEKLMINRSRVVIVICPALEDTVRATAPDANVVLIENAPGSAEDQATLDQAAAIRTKHGIARETPLVLYTGTFEHYQGLDLLYAAMQRVIKARPDAQLVLVGGEPAQVEAARKEIAALGLSDSVVLTGQRPAEEIPAYLDAATLLVSPRSTGTNTPLKIYQYLRSGRPIVATNLRTHTQVLAEDTAFLAEPTADGFAATILAALNDPARAASIGAHARQLAETKYSDAAYIAKTSQAVDLLFGDAPATVTRGVA